MLYPCLYHFTLSEPIDVSDEAVCLYTDEIGHRRKIWLHVHSEDTGTA